MAARPITQLRRLARGWQGFPRAPPACYCLEAECLPACPLAAQPTLLPTPHHSKPSTIMSSPAPTPFPFVSRDPKTREPPRSDWEAFEHPCLRRFPDPDSIKLRSFLGRGTQGFVFEAKVGDKGPLTVKCVRTTTTLPSCFTKIHQPHQSRHTLFDLGFRGWCNRRELWTEHPREGYGRPRHEALGEVWKAGCWRALGGKGSGGRTGKRGEAGSTEQESGRLLPAGCCLLVASPRACLTSHAPT